MRYSTGRFTNLSAGMLLFGLLSVNQSLAADCGSAGIACVESLDKTVVQKVLAYKTNLQNRWNKAFKKRAGHLAKPRTLAPKRKTKQQQPLYRWQAVRGATAYELDLPEYSGLIRVAANEVGCSRFGVECQLPTSAVLQNAKYRWRVRALATNKVSKWSGFRGFRVAYQPPIQPDLAGLFPAGLEHRAIPFAQWQDAIPAPMDTPSYLSHQVDSDTRHKVWRLGGSGAEMGGAPGTALEYPDGNGALGVLHGQHFYSKVSPVNSDETYVLGAGGQNQQFAALWKLDTYELVAWVPAAEKGKELHVEQRHLMWDRIKPNVYWYTQANELVRATINFNDYSVQTEIWDTFPEYEHITLGYGEGNFSDNGKRLVITAKSALDSYTYFIPYLAHKRKQLPRRQVTSPEQPEFDWAGVDPTGKYILFNRINPDRQTQPTGDY